MMDLWSIIPYYVAHLCASLKGQGVPVTVGTVRYHLDRKYFRNMGLSPDPLLADFGGEISYRLLRRIVKSAEYCLNLLFLAIRVASSRPDILHIQYLPFLGRGIPFEIWFVRWVRFLGIPVVYTVHNVTLPNGRREHDAVYSRVYRTSDALICHGKEARSELVRDFGISEKRIWVIPHGPLFEGQPGVSQEEARKKLGLPQDEVLVLSFGVISEYKGIPYLLESWKHVQARGLKARLIIAGTGDPTLVAAIRNQVSREALSTSVDLRLRFIAVDELPLLHESADILVYPSKGGTTSGALLTGLNYAKPIVATRLPYFQENLQEGETALFVDYGDVEGLAETLSRLICDSRRRQTLATNLRERGMRHAEWADIAAATLNCYRSVWRRIDQPKELSGTGRRFYGVGKTN